MQLKNVTDYPQAPHGLTLRWSTAEDTEEIVKLIKTVFSGIVEEPPYTNMEKLARRIMRGDHPTLKPGDFALIEDCTSAQPRLLGCTSFWQQLWEYEGIAFKVGRPEIIATVPDYRNQGLIKALFALVHQRGAAEGDMVQVITGIPHFYRQFGYEYALDLWESLVVSVADLPQLPADTGEPYLLRDACIEDIPLIKKLYDAQRRKGIVSRVIDEQWWRYQVENWCGAPAQALNSHIQLIVNPMGERQGYIITPVPRAGKYVQVWDIEVLPEVNMADVIPAVLRALVAQRACFRETLLETAPLSEIRFMLVRNHPLFKALDPRLISRHEVPYAWYVYVADLAAFLRAIAPALENRLAHSLLADFDGEIKINLYRGGLRLLFKRGQLLAVENWQRPVDKTRLDASFPALVFLQLLFGYRSLPELRHAFPDVWVADQSELLLKTLFPTRPSWILPLG